MKKTVWIFLLACLLACLIPSVGMLFFPTNETTENHALAAAPRLFADGKLNPQVFSEFEKWFTAHHAGRNEMVSADAKIQKAVFGTSNVDGVIVGEDGWLYYASTLPDYLGTNRMSEADLHALANNFAVVQQYLEDKGIGFVLTLPPNKNTLYGEHMPYYDGVIVSSEHDLTRLAPLLDAQGVRYTDLLTLFEAQDETLYLKRDSHWNSKGAYLAYSELMDALGRPYEEADALDVRETLVDGDLNRMLYSFYGPREKDLSFTPEALYTMTAGESVEDHRVVTENADGQGTLLMYRDSFANTLIPFLSNDFAAACYDKGFPNGLESAVEEFTPDCVILEKVERNIKDYLETPPLLTAPAAEEPMRFIISETETTLSVIDCPNDFNFVEFRGTADPAYLAPDAAITLSVNGRYLRAYRTQENGFLLYLKKADLPQEPADIRVFAESGEECRQLLRAKPDWP